MFKVKLRPVKARSVTDESGVSSLALAGNESEFNTDILKGDPIGRRDIGLNVPLPAQPEAFKKVVTEKVEQFKKNGVAMTIDVWKDQQSGLTYIMDGQHRFIAAAVLGMPVNLNWKKLGIRPSQVDWGGTKYIEGVPAKDKIKQKN
ncbi:hypothetical protein Z042_03640 [Chania multitudinisentens RB-25]|uniref:Uncharacterized protein n=1 Tax=Chania multitudinisentens RB-25 TaxID=1441930 RepID=W0L8S2_9GAMM|nr:ParB N-terminal domain-containing protein [Chania multitudinisentens]AHG18799.1 hypothetical protein Z042_03630 [Chania multitudinisentens RB-25]AHG18801.1 hypothetical protein Z042_03640 [Chania multitudinisentens RB-25]